jgi:hypothetical protein
MENRWQGEPAAATAGAAVRAPAVLSGFLRFCPHLSGGVRFCPMRLRFLADRSQQNAASGQPQSKVPRSAANVFEHGRGQQNELTRIFPTNRSRSP